MSKARAPEAQLLFFGLCWVPAVICVGVVLYLLYVFGHVARIPLLASAPPAYWLTPIVQVLERRRLPRAISAIFTLLGVALAIIAL